MTTLPAPSSGPTLEALLAGVVVRDPEVHHGDPVFAGTRVPVWTLVDYLEGGESLDTFLENFPSVRREQAVAALEVLRRGWSPPSR